jgi:hypothetical protein
MIGFERGDEPKTGEGTPKTRTVADRLNPDGVAIKREVHFVARRDPEVLPKLFWNHDLAFCAHSVSHTNKYNFPSQR